MTGSRDAWAAANEQLRVVGSMFRDEYEKGRSGEATPGPTHQDVEDALETLSESAVSALGAIGEAVRRPDFNEEAKEAAGLVLEALGRSISDLGHRLSSPEQSEPEEPVRDESDRDEPTPDVD